MQLLILISRDTDVGLLLICFLAMVLHNKSLSLVSYKG